jgi:hypothetical protein
MTESKLIAFHEVPLNERPNLLLSLVPMGIPYNQLHTVVHLILAKRVARGQDGAVDNLHPDERRQIAPEERRR